MTISNLKTVRKAVWDARAKWFNIGRELGLSMSNLQAIEVSYNRVEQCFSEMLTLWLQFDPYPTWSALVDALQSPTVGCKELHVPKHLKSEVTDLGPATEVQVGEFIGWHTYEYMYRTLAKEGPIRNIGPLPLC